MQWYLYLLPAIQIPINQKKQHQTKQQQWIQTQNHEVMKPAVEQLYACSMHPEVIGKKDEKCSKCGMKLTEPVKK